MDGNKIKKQVSVSTVEHIDGNFKNGTDSFQMETSLGTRALLCLIGPIDPTNSMTCHMLEVLQTGLLAMH